MEAIQKIGKFILGAIRKLDPVLFSCATLLSIISIFTIWGAVDNFGRSKLRMQIFIFIIGIIVTILIAYVDFRVIVDKLWLPMLIGSVALLLLTLLVGSSGENMETSNKSWLAIPGTGLMIQPSEFVKFTFICTFSKHLFTVKEHINKPLTVLALGAHALLIIGLILASGDLGVALIYIAIFAIMLFCAGLHPAYFLGVVVVAVLLSPYLWEVLSDYQQQRIIVGFNPEAYPDSRYSWQPLLSKKAIAAGGWIGNGLFGGEHYEILAASHTDFIYATICEKFGFLGGMLVILIFLVMVVRVFMIAHTASHSDYGGFICVGIGAMLIVQILLNIGMCFAMLPVIGITLPLLSCGGSSMLATFMMLGLLHNVYSHSDAVRVSEKNDTLDIDISLLDS
ncbi:MAG: FtsW/RodA/SpoVE family cell cycle protein [Clostridia bacterium]|nr:FtsW/RodA/SpoVE family cell cycle protein [Clostridia bacterium]